MVSVAVDFCFSCEQSCLLQTCHFPRPLQYDSPASSFRVDKYSTSARDIGDLRPYGRGKKQRIDFMRSSHAAILRTDIIESSGAAILFHSSVHGLPFFPVSLCIVVFLSGAGRKTNIHSMAIQSLRTHIHRTFFLPFTS